MGPLLTMRPLWPSVALCGPPPCCSDDGEEDEEGSDDCMMRLISLTGDRQLMVFGTLKNKETGVVRLVAKTFTLRGSLTDTKIVPLSDDEQKHGFKSCRVVGKDSLVCIGHDGASVHVLYHNAMVFAQVDLPGKMSLSAFAAGISSSAPASVLQSEQGLVVVKVGDGTPTLPPVFRVFFPHFRLYGGGFASQVSSSMHIA